MLLEKILFNIIAFSLFSIIFFKMIKKNDTTYVAILCLEAIGIAMGFIEIIFTIHYSLFIKIIMYVLAVVIPLIIILIESRKLNFSELIYLALTKTSLLFNNTKQAKNFLISLVNKYPESYLGHKILAEIYEKEGGMRKAIDEYVQVIDINKKDYDSYYKISFLLNDLGKKDEAAQMLESLLKRKPEYIEATQLLGDILCEKEMYKEAANIYNDALKYNPNSYELYYNMGMVYTMLNDFKNAKDCYEKAAEINTLLYNSYYNLAQINLIFNDLEEAEKFFLKSVEGEDVEAKSYYGLAKIYMLKGDKQNAIRYINIAIEVDNSYYKKAEAEPIFIPIKSYINYPNFEEEEKRKTNLTKKEIKAQKHLEKTTKLVGKLSLNSLKMKKEKQIDAKELDERE